MCEHVLVPVEDERVEGISSSCIFHNKPKGVWTYDRDAECKYFTYFLTTNPL